MISYICSEESESKKNTDSNKDLSPFEIVDKHRLPSSSVKTSK